MAETQPFMLQGLCYTADEFRESLADLVCGEGVVDLHGGDLIVASTGAADNSVTVAAGSAYIQNSDSTDETQMYRVLNDQTMPLVTLQLGVGGGGDPRVDTIYGYVSDAQYAAGTDTWALAIQAGNANPGAALTDAGIAASAVTPAPTGDSGFIILAYVLVDGSDTLTHTITAGDILDARNNYFKCGAAPHVTLKAAANQTGIGNGVATKLDLATTEHLDRDYFTVSASVITIVQDGLYDLNAFIAVTGTLTAASAHFLGITRGGTTEWIGHYLGPSTSSHIRNTVSMGSFPLSAGQTLRLTVNVTGSPISTGYDVASGNICRLTVRKVG